MSLLDSITVLKVRKKSYILFYTGLKRGQKHYEVMSPNGTTICESVCYDDAVEACQLHYVKTTPAPRRCNKVEVRKVQLGDAAELNRGNDAQTDKTHLADYAEWSFGDSAILDIQIPTHSKRFL